MDGQHTTSRKKDVHPVDTHALEPGNVITVSWCVLTLISDLSRGFMLRSPTVGQQSPHSQPTVGRKTSRKTENDSLPTVGQQSADSFWGAVLHFFHFS